ncbi:MAG: DUF5686 family protein [Bacteroidia bacterium]
MNRILLILICLFFSAAGQAQYYTVSGFVADSTLQPIEDANIYITNGSVMGKTDNFGYYKFELREGEYELVFTHRNFQSVHVKIVLSTHDDTVNIILPYLIKSVGQANVTVKWKDPGPEMMRKAIEKREYWNSRIPAHSTELYIRAFEEYNKPKKNKKAWEVTDSTKSKKQRQSDDNGPVASMAEIILQRDWTPAGQLKEVRSAVSYRGDRSSLFYTSTTEGDFNFYQNLVTIPGLSDMPVVSPLNYAAIASYKFSFLGSYKDDLGRRILKIKVQPRLVTNSVFSGEIHLVDSLFCIYRTDLHFPATQLNEYNDFIISQEYTLTQDTFLQFADQRFDYYAKAGKGKYSGYTLVKYRNYIMPAAFPKGHFGMEISATSDSAYEKDSSFWNTTRAVPLNAGEIKFITRSDSIKRVLNSKEYLDSMQKINNKVTFYKLLLSGQEYQNREKGLTISFQPLMFIAQPWYPGGVRLNVWNTINKEFKSKRSINFVENLSYGINNKDIRGTVIFSTLFDPYHRGFFYASVGRDFNFINGNAAFLDLAKRANFYQNTHLSAYVRRELINGLYLRIRSEISERKDISNFVFDALGDQIFGDNPPSVFGTHRAFIGTATLQYTPFQKYIREPRQKVILGSRWPTFFVSYSKGIPGVLQSVIDYNYLEFGLDQEMQFALWGRSELRVNSGSFLSSKKVSLVDYRYQRRGDVLLFTPPMFAFQTLDSTFATFNRFYELHYRHHFNGALLNKIPFVKKLGLRESAGINLLYAPERRNMFFYEFYVGIDKLVKVWRERFKIGLYYAAGYSNIYEQPIYGFKVNFEYFDRRDNSW